MSGIKTPFDKDTFSEDAKPLISGIDLDLDYENIESSISKVAIDCMDIIGKKLYNNLCSGSATEDKNLQAEALDYLKRAMLHFCLYEHLIFLITRVKNSGVTVAKTEHETTIFKYQQLELQDKFISLGWFWMNQLIVLLNENAEKFPDWSGSDEQNSLGDIPIELSDFKKWVSVNDEYFFIVTQSLIREVWMDCVESRTIEPKKTDAVARALCYEVMGRACKRLSYFLLPEPIRRDISSEMGKNHAAQEDKTVRERIADIYLGKAASYWTGWEVDLKSEAVKEQQKKVSDQPRFTAPRISQNDSFVY